MTLRTAISLRHETLSDLAFSAGARFDDAVELLASGRFAGAVYFFGFSAEMWLKLAAAHCRDPFITPTTAWDGAPIKRWMERNAPMIQRESYHSLEFWSEFIILFRDTSTTPLSSEMAGQLRHHVVRRLYQDWHVNIRYRALPVAEHDAWRVYQDAEWVRRNWTILWR